MDVNAYCEAKAAKSGSSFYYSFKVLAKEKRYAITALYAFCREVDDIVDECSDKSLAATKLNWWREEIENLFQKKPQHPVTKALLPSLEQYNLSQQYFMDIIEGMQMDLQYSGYETFHDLNLYCYRVASAVGLLAIEIFGYQDQNTVQYARDLGVALQLTNILRDVKEDALMGRVYIPLEEMNLYKLKANAFLGNETTEEINALFALQAQRARQYYTKALDNLTDRDRFNQLSGIIMADIYQALLTEIELDGFRILEHKIKLTPLRKLWIAAMTYLRERKLQRRYLHKQYG